MSKQIKILFLASNPRDISRIRLDEELREVDERIRLGNCRDRLELIPHFAVRAKDIRETLLRHEPHVLHFSGHGSPTAGIVLEDNNGRTQMVSADALADLFQIIKDNLRVVVLNACYSATQAKGISKVVDCTIGMQHKIGDHSAIVFSGAFYDGLAFGRNVQVAFGLGVNALKMECPTESNIPALLTKRGTKAAEVYLASREVIEPQPGSEIQEKQERGGQSAIQHFEKNSFNAKGDIDITGIRN